MEDKEYAIYLLRRCLIHNFNLTDLPDIDHIEYRTRFLELTDSDCDVFHSLNFTSCSMPTPGDYLGNFLSALELQCSSASSLSYIPILFLLIFLLIK